MTVETLCRECYSQITVDFEIEPGQRETRHEPGWPPEAVNIKITAACDCEQDADDYGDDLLDAARNAAERTH